jgi:hypothetical protein
LSVELVKVKLGAGMQLDAQLRSGAAEGCGLSENNFVGLSVHRRKTGKGTGTRSKGKLATIDHARIVIQTGARWCHIQASLS